MWRHLTRAAAAGLLAAAMVAAGSSSAVAAAQRTAPARHALRRAEALFHPQAGARDGATSPRDGTLALRDLALHIGELSAAGRRAAHGLLARPADPYDPNTNPDAWTTPEAAASPEGGPDVCVHWTGTGTNAPDLTDVAGNGFP